MTDKQCPTDVMPASEFRRLRREMALDITHCALLLNLASARTIRRYEDGETPVSGPAGILMMVLRDVPGAFDYVDALAQKRDARQARD